MPFPQWARDKGVRVAVRARPGGGGYRRTVAAAVTTVLATGAGLLAGPATDAAELEPTAPESGVVRNGTAKAIATIGLAVLSPTYDHFGAVPIFVFTALAFPIIAFGFRSTLAKR